MTRNSIYGACGVIIALLLGLLGWIGFTALIIKLANTLHVVNPGIYALYAPFALLICLPFAKGNGTVIIVMILYLTTTIHLIGKRLLFVDVE